MIQIHTRFLGALQCPADSVVTFPLGIPPFVDQQQFVVISKENSPFFFLQSVTTPELCFITLPVRAVDSNYKWMINPDDLETLGLAADGPSFGDELTSLTILTIPEHGLTTANLAAPVLINTSRNIGVQTVRPDSAYSHTHPLELGG